MAKDWYRNIQSQGPSIKPFKVKGIHLLCDCCCLHFNYITRKAVDIVYKIRVVVSCVTDNLIYMKTVASYLPCIGFVGSDSYKLLSRALYM